MDALALGLYRRARPGTSIMQSVCVVACAPQASGLECAETLKAEIHDFASQQLDAISKEDYVTYHARMKAQTPWLEARRKDVLKCTFELAKAGEDDKSLTAIDVDLTFLRYHFGHELDEGSPNDVQTYRAIATARLQSLAKSILDIHHPEIAHMTSGASLH